MAPSTTWTPGLGWDGVDVTNEETLIYKNGAVPGYQAQINLYTTEGFGVAVAFNLTLPYYVPGNVNAGTISTDINDALLRATAEVSGSVTDGSGGAPESGWQVYVDEDYNGQVTLGALSTTTNSQGFYSFPAVPPGEITIRIAPPGAGWALLIRPRARARLRSRLRKRMTTRTLSSLQYPPSQLSLAPEPAAIR